MLHMENTADGILVGEQSNDAAMVEAHMMARREYGDNHTRDFLGIRNGLKTGGGMVADHNENGFGTTHAWGRRSNMAEADAWSYFYRSLDLFPEAN
ncbi:hypothetical protein ACET3Z_032156 [Daucus carota]